MNKNNMQQKKSWIADQMDTDDLENLWGDYQTDQNKSIMA